MENVQIQQHSNAQHSDVQEITHSQNSLILQQPQFTEIEIQQMKIIDIVRYFCPEQWKCLFWGNEGWSTLSFISEILATKELQEGMFFPLKRNLFKSFHHTNMNNIKIVIVGQDPYPHLRSDGLPTGIGLSFAVDRGDVVPRSLQTIYKELERSIPGFVVPNHGDLTSWADQGVFLLNACLTVKHKDEGGHKNIWLPFISLVIRDIELYRPGTIFMLWGKKAQEMKQYFKKMTPLEKAYGNVTNGVIVLECSHPTARGNYNDFVGSNHFATANAILMSRGIQPINWQL